MIRGALLAATILVAVLLWRDHSSLERGNRLYRGGDPPSAAQVYGTSRERVERLRRVQYNLGTALLGIDPDSAGALLRRATEAEDRATARRGLYNLGYRLLTLAQGPLERDSLTAVLTEAVEHNRAAYRLDPTDQDARWNLALAQRRLEALVPPDAEVGRESGGESDDEVASNEQSLARSETAESQSGPEPEEPEAADNSGERQGPRVGAREAWATQDPGPMTRTEAFGLLATVSDEPELLIRGILWSRRPDVAWWANQAYPGGPW